VSSRRVYHGAVRAISVGFIALGLATLVRTLSHGGGPASVGFFIGLAFVGIGIGRIWAGARMSGGGE
jgi:hypothetical protein